MDPLEEQLAQLNLMNSRVIPSRGTYSPAESLPLYHDDLMKKHAPLVPPKPEKKVSSGGSFLGESLYATSKELKPSPPPLVSRQPADIYHKTNKETLDNPAVLEQKLEALAYHKQQLEKKKSLNQQASFENIPKLSSSSLVYKAGLRPKPQQQQPLTSNAIYSNYQVAKGVSPIPGKVAQAASIYGNIIQKSVTPTPLDVGAGGAEPLQVVTSNRPTPKPLNMNNYKIYCNVPYEKEPSKFEMNASSSIIPNSVPLTTQILSMQAPDDDFAREQEDLPPPSPVSSSYSELRRATNIFQNSMPSANHSNNGISDKNSPSLLYASTKNSSGVHPTYGEVYMDNSSNNEFSNYSLNTEGAGSSTYESIYEPINPRPSSQLSARFNYLNYSPYENAAVIAENNAALMNHSNFSSLPRNTYPDPHQNHDPKHPHKNKVELGGYLEETIEDESPESDGYGVCFKCNQRVIDETSGCTAMDQIYHIACFTCFQCQINLQGKPFYGIDGKPYCEYDYLQTLEKCSVCMKPILERILRATGKPYHPQCFTCVVCGNSLDGIPFTVDATNQNYCIEDFHKKFAPRCCVCKEPIMPEPGEEETVRVVALDRSFHLQCYKCEDCGLLLSSEAEGRGCYPLDDHVLCKSCNARRVQLLTNRMTTEL